MITCQLLSVWSLTLLRVFNIGVAAHPCMLARSCPHLLMVLHACLQISSATNPENRNTLRAGLAAPEPEPAIAELKRKCECWWEPRSQPLARLAAPAEFSFKVRWYGECASNSGACLCIRIQVEPKVRAIICLSL